MKTIRSILHRRLIIWLIIGWIFASLAILLTTASQVRESIAGRSSHTAQMMLAFAATQNLSIVKPVLPDQSTFTSFGVEDFFTVIIQNEIVRYSSIGVPNPILLTLPLSGRVTLLESTWELYGANTPQNETRVVIGVSAWEIINATIGPASIVALIVFFFAGFTMFITTRATRIVVEPLEELTKEEEVRGENNLSAIQSAMEIEELSKIQTALNHLLNRLDEAMRRERQFIFNAAHELRTPLAAIRAQVEAIDTNPEHPLQPEQINGVLMATDRASRMVGQMLDLARSESIEPQSSSNQTIDLENLAQQVIADLAPHAYRQNGEIALRCTEPITIQGNYDLLYSMLHNLIENAVNYSTAPAIVIVTIGYAKDGQKYFSVEDNGLGLDDSQFACAAQKFERLDQKSDGGVGLGLSIVFQIVKKTGIALSKEEATLLGGLRLVLRFPNKPGVSIPA